jgi:hypothetical protein
MKGEQGMQDSFRKIIKELNLEINDAYTVFI